MAHLPEMPAPFERAASFIKTFMKEMKDDDLPGLAAELAFRFFMALFPFMLVLVTLSGYVSRWFGVDDPAGEVLDAVGDSLPADAASVLSNQIDGVVSGANLGLLSIGLATAVWSAAGGAGALMKAINRVYDLPETRSAPMKTLIAIGITLFGGLGLLLGVAAMILTQTWAGEIASAIGLGREFGWLVQLARVPLIILFVAGAIEGIYWIAPNRWARPRLASPGALFSAMAWAVFTVGFAFYVANFGNYNATYGAIAGVVILLFWFNSSALVVLMGAELNSVLAARRAEAVQAESPAPPAAIEPVRSAAREPVRGAPVLEVAAIIGATLAVATWLRGRKD
jgi:membrane protein